VCVLFPDLVCLFASVVFVSPSVFYWLLDCVVYICVT
jgi:hypothetical protein